MMKICHIRRRIQEGGPKINYFCKDVEGTLWFKERHVVPKKEALKRKILDEAHVSRYSIHPGSTKMYHDLRQLAMCQNVIPVERSKLII
jgi:hypothetical protein